MLIILYPLFWFFLLNEKRFKKVVKLKVFTARLILFFQGIKVKNISKTKLEDTPYVICANHSSYLDILTMYATFKHHRFLFIGKSELLTWPIVSIFFKKIDIAIDRKKPRQAIKSLERAKRELHNKWSISIFPEGIIPDNAPELSRFKNGAFKMAIEAQVPILPVTFLNNVNLFKTEPILTANAHPGISKVIVHKPISTKGLTQKDLVSLRNKTFEVINKSLLDFHNK